MWEQFEALLPEQRTNLPLGCHRRRIPDRVVFGKLVEVLVFGCAYWRIVDEGCSASTLRPRRDEWIEEGVMDTLRGIVLEAYATVSSACRWASWRLTAASSRPHAEARRLAGARWTGGNGASSARRSWMDVASRLGS
jgi:transposase